MSATWTNSENLHGRKVRDRHLLSSCADLFSQGWIEIMYRLIKWKITVWVTLCKLAEMLYVFSVPCALMHEIQLTRNWNGNFNIHTNRGDTCLLDDDQFSKLQLLNIWYHAKINTSNYVQQCEAHCINWYLSFAWSQRACPEIPFFQVQEINYKAIEVCVMLA